MPRSSKSAAASSSSSSAKAKKKATRAQQTFDALHKEMEIVEYATTTSGQRVRRVPRAQAPKRTAKRKALQREDLDEMAITADDDDDDEEEYKDEEEQQNEATVKRKATKRLRGSMVAFEDVVLKSMPLASSSSSSAKKKGKSKRQNNGNSNKSDNDDDDENEQLEEVQQTESERYEMLQEVAKLGINVDTTNRDEEEGDDDDENYEDSGEEQEEDELVEEKSGSSSNNNNSDLSTSKQKTKRGPYKKNTKKNRVLHRMREFSSHRMAQQHGEAIAAHVRGQSDIAVAKLRQVAQAAPTAPQVYSSLGMVYESMLTEVEKEIDNRMAFTDPSATTAYLGDETFVKLIERQLELARKTYGSYHVASLLCKRDFVLWERSGDAAIRVSHIFDDVIMMYKSGDKNSVSTKSGEKKSNDVDPEDESDRFDPNAGPEKWRADRKVWYKHAFSAYDAADKLRPPGVDIPCKLAEVQMNLGNYIQALSILTDLRNKANGKSSRSGMEESPSCWLLYADLMLKIGYECKKWNENMVPSHRNTFKRWLRKYSKSFDWKERRLQALCLALEAAAGSASCSELVKWMRKRAQKYIEKNEKEDADIDDTANDNDDDDDDEEAGNETRKDDDANTDAHNVTGSTSKNTEVLTYDQKRGELVKQNGLDLDRFDAMTKEMNLAKTSRTYRDRVAAREELVERHRHAIKELALLEQHGGPNQKNDDNDFALDQSDDLGPTKILPMQSSCATVYNICRLLLRQCLHLGLYEGGVLVVQSVLRYLQERASRKEKGNNSQQCSTDQLLGGGLVQSGFGYDQLHHDSDESDDDSVIFLSDDEELQDPGTLQSFKDGVLPIDVNAMYSVCLLGAGGQDYVALNNLENILRSNQLEMFDKEEFPSEVSQGDEHDWIAFKKHFASPLGKTSMVAIIAGVVKDRTPGLSSRRILGLLRSHLKVIDHNDGLDDLLSGPNVLLRANILRILLAAAQLMLRCDALELKKLHEPGINETEIVKNVAADVLQTLTTLTRFQHVMWCPNNLDWSLKGVSIETLSIFAESLDVLVQAMAVVKSEGLIDTVEVALMKSRYLMSTIFHAESPAAKPSITFNYKTWRTFPLPIKECQTEFERKLSTKTYNLCVALCVSAFSGWEPEEFRVDKLRSRDDDTNFFGITFSNDRVAGFLSRDITSVISQQWQRVQSMLPNLEVLDFESHMDDRKNTDWYQSAMNNVEQQTGKVAIFGEEEGIKSLLSFSTLCLVAAATTKKKNDKGDLLKLSMSILLPITQFIIDKQIWDSQIGAETRKEKDEVEYYLGEQMQWMGPAKTSKEVRFQPAPRPYLHIQQQQQQQQQALRSSLTQKPPAPRPKISEVVKVPTSVLLEEWNKHGSSAETNAPNAVRDMKQLDDAMKNLRKSRTLNALERSAVDVSAALVDVAANEQCFNPFLCLQQAAMYAEIGSKMGSNDEPFKRCLPSKEICTALEALVVLGRADCLRAIHFLHEAQYLCSWVISVCRLHRDRQEASFTWDARWRVVGILCYVVKATIDESGEAHYNNNNKSAWPLRAWGDEAQEEANRGKSDALILVGAESSEVSNEVDTAVNSNGYYGSNMLHASQNGFAAEQLDYNQQLGELPVPNIDDVQIQMDEYDGIQVVGI